MRNLITSLSLFTLLMPVSAFAQEPVTLDEIPEESSTPAAPAETAPADGTAPAEAPPAEPAPAAEPAAEPVQLDETGGDAAASGSTSAGFTASGTTAAAPLAPAPAAATAEAPAEEQAPLTRPGASTFRGPGGGDSWDFSYSGYFRAPMRVGISNNTGLQHRAELGTDQNPDGLVVAHSQDDTGAWQVDGTLPKKTTFHLPVVPDMQYGSWQNTSHQQNDWAEMFFSVGNGTVSGTLAIQGFQFTDSAWKEPISQFGIGQGWVEINSDLGFENVKFNTKVGSH